jgi:hypothetical protein
MVEVGNVGRCPVDGVRGDGDQCGVQSEWLHNVNIIWDGD